MFAKPRPSCSRRRNSKDDVGAHRRGSKTDSKGRTVVSLQQSAVTSKRLFEWKEQALSKQAKQFAAQDARKRQEDAYLAVMQSKVMSHKSVAAAAERNYEVAQEVQRRRLELKTQLERALDLKEIQECTFQPRLFTPPSELANVRPKFKEVKPLNKTEILAKTKENQIVSTAVFDRLYRPVHRGGETGREDPSGEQEHACVQVANIVEFLQRQEQFQRAREEKLQKLAQESKCSFSPQLSERTRELSLANRVKSMDELLEHERERRERKLEKCLGHRISRKISRNVENTETTDPETTRIFTAPAVFTALLLQLQDQAERMKAMERDWTFSPSGPRDSRR